MQKPIYLDYAATTPVDPQVAEKMSACLTGDGIFGNPASRSHLYGWQAEEVVETARGQVAELVAADPREVVWTSGATEANNLALKGLAYARRERGKHIVTSSMEHKAVLDVCAVLEREGFSVSYVEPDAEGLIQPQAVYNALQDDTILVSLMHVNNEVGSITDIAAIGQVCRERDIAFHVDAAQSAGKLPIDVHAMNIDLLALSAHKFYGPKGIGALIVRRSPAIKLQALIHGGGHERGLRSGTLATHQIAGMGEAARLAGECLPAEAERVAQLRERFWRGINDLPGLRLNGPDQQRSPGHLNVSFGEVDGEMLLIELRELAVSTGSACTSASVEPSYVLKAMGISDVLAHSSIRFSFGRYTSEQEVGAAVQTVRRVVASLTNNASPASLSQTV